MDYMRFEGMQQITQGLILRMAIAHSHFEAVHPFRDGNGRVGRLLLPLMMAAGITRRFISHRILKSIKTLTTDRSKPPSNVLNGMSPLPFWLTRL